MVLVLAIGDLNVPYGAAALPEKFQRMLVPGKIQYVFVTGNLNTREVEEFFVSLGAEVFITRGDLDVTQEYPDRLVVSIAGVSLGLIHGHQLIPYSDSHAAIALKRDMGVDVLITGFQPECKITQPEDGGLLVCPGSATGTNNTYFPSSGIPSFVLMDLQGSRIVTYTYMLIHDDVKVERIVYDKSVRTIPT
ncbi:Vacuolar protein sorting-associated protein 29 [Porphyridium purpureum]|uniref:Vacuolar protein sorting-associated protein 29 n=1 Tax=Porphyridium purpureum TaxID=35688 RepID=A0A5J4Z1E6_PORPP|nr:Vacuolar protein sorting-associated protein 29 [Porphyridium purpureum]|eukprot:POR6264..scf208_2